MTTTATRTKTTDIFEIAAALDGKVTFSDIAFSQVLQCEHGKGVNDILFIGQRHGMYFYTSRTTFENLITLRPQKFATLVCCPNSKNLFELKA